MRRTVFLVVTALLPVALAAQTRTTLDVYVIDVEGGNATLFAAPSGQAVLIDTASGVLQAGSDPRKDGCALAY